MNVSLADGIFPDALKIAAVFPIDKASGNKNIVSNFWPVSVLRTFSKIYKLTIKN